MTPERMAELVARWVRRYTRNLTPAVAERRIEEVDADLHDHIAHERACGVPDRRIAAGIASRMVRGLAADAAWRRHTISRPSASEETRRMRRSALRVALVTAVLLLVPLVAMQVDDEVAWSVGDFVLAGVLVGGTGLLLEAAARKPGRMAHKAATVTIG